MKVIRSAAVVLTAVLVVLLPGASYADTLLRADPAGDVQYLPTSSEEEVDPVLAPARTIGDITQVKVTHEGTAVRVVTYFRALPKAGQFHAHEFRFVTASLERTVSLSAGPAPVGWAGRARMFTKSGNDVTCKYLAHLLDYAHNRTILTVPRKCLNFPGAVKVGSGTYMLAGDRVYFDDGYLNAGNTDNLTLSTAVTR